MIPFELLQHLYIAENYSMWTTVYMQLYSSNDSSRNNNKPHHHSSFFLRITPETDKWSWRCTVKRKISIKRM